MNKTSNNSFIYSIYLHIMAFRKDKTVTINRPFTSSDLGKKIMLEAFTNMVPWQENAEGNLKNRRKLCL